MQNSLNGIAFFLEVNDVINRLEENKKTQKITRTISVISACTLVATMIALVSPLGALPSASAAAGSGGGCGIGGCGEDFTDDEGSEIKAGFGGGGSGNGGGEGFGRGDLHCGEGGGGNSGGLHGSCF
jgi:hypothetical protein